jgi:hypothetical protein
MLYREKQIMKASLLYILSISVLAISSCNSAREMTQPVATKTEYFLPTPFSPTFTLSPSTSIPATITPTAPPTQTPTLTPPATLEPEQAREKIQTLLQGPTDCAAPCFWRITPGQTTLDEARNIITRLGLEMINTNPPSGMIYEINYKNEDGTAITPLLTVQDDIVLNINLHINFQTYEGGVITKWSAYSPGILVKRYGMPSRVDFGADWGPAPSFEMKMYFDSVNLIVQYFGTDIIPLPKGPTQFCPLAAHFSSVWLWMGKNPLNPPIEALPIEKVTSLTIEEFSQLMTGDPQRACFIFNGGAFQTNR